MSKKVLLLGSSYSAVDILQRLRQRNLHITVCGSYKDDPCHIYADESIYIDYSKPELLEKLLKEKNFDFLLPSCNDFSYMTGADLADQFGFAGFDSIPTTNILHNKQMFREYCQGRIKVPVSFSSLAHASEYLELNAKHELIVKPVDSFSGKGVTRVNKTSELERAVEIAKNSSRSREYVVEEFVPGELYSHSAFLKNNRIQFDFFVDEFCLTYPYQVDASNHPSRLSDTLKNGVREEIEKLAGLLNLTDGLLHTQFTATANDFWIIECMRRCPGDLYFKLIEYSTGVDYIDKFVLSFLMEELEPVETDFTVTPVIRHTVSSTEKLVFSDYETLIPSEKITHFPLKLAGEEMEPAPYDKAAIVFIETRSTSDLWQYTHELKKWFRLNSFNCNYTDK